MEEFIQLVNSKKKRGRPRKVQATGEGLGDILTSVKKTAQKVARSVGSKILGKKLAEKVERYGDAVLFLNKLPLSPAVKETLRKHGDEPILKMAASRKPVRKVLNALMNAVSLGSFNKKFARQPYDDLFHLTLWVTTASGTYSIEKEEVIKITPNPKTEEQAEFNDISPVPSALTMNKLMMGGEKVLGDKFTRYDASSNNCQDFIIALLEGSNAGSAADRAFIKQDVDALFKDDTFLRRVARKLTNIGASVSTAITGVDDKPVASTKTASQFEIPSPADASVTDGMQTGAGKRKRDMAGDEGERGRRRREVRGLLRRAYPLDGSAVDPAARALIADFAPADVIPNLLDRQVPEDIIVEILIALLPAGFSDPTGSPVPTQDDFFNRPPPPPPPAPSVGRGRGRPRKTPASAEPVVKKLQSGEPKKPYFKKASKNMTAWESFAEEFHTPSPAPKRLKAFEYKPPVGELSATIPLDSSGAGMKRGRGRPRKMVGGVVISPAQRSAIEDFLNMHYTSFLRSRYNPDKFEKVKKEIFDEIIPEMSSMGAINKKLAEQLMIRYETRR